MIAITEFPKEILRIIFSNLKRKEDDCADLEECALTCRAWRQSAQEMMFHTVVMRREKALIKIADIVEQNSFIGRSVRVVLYRCYAKTRGDDDANLKIISQAFPHLEELRYTEQSRLGMLSLYRFLLAGKFPHLSKLLMPLSYDIADVNVSCIEHMKNQISMIELREDEVHKNDTLHYLSGKLNQYPKLGTVTFISWYYTQINDKKKGITDYFELLNVMTATLKKVVLTAANIKSLLNTDFCNIQPMLHIKELYVTIHETPWHNANLLYLMKYFPSLQSLQLHWEDRGNFIYIGDKKLCFKFLDYLVKVPTHSVKSIAIDLSSSSEIIRHYLQNIQNRQGNTCQTKLVISTVHYRRPISEQFLIVGMNSNAAQRRNVIQLSCVRHTQLKEYKNVLCTLGEHQFQCLEINNEPEKFGLANIEGILGCLPHVSHLSIKGAVKHSQTSNGFSPFNLKTLDIEYLTWDVVNFITQRFPKLDSLQINLVDPYRSRGAPFKILLKRMTLRCLILYFPEDLRLFCDSIYIKIRALGEDKFKVFVVSVNRKANAFTHQLQNCVFTEADFYNGCNNGNTLTFDITCGAVKKLILKDCLGRKLCLSSHPEQNDPFRMVL